MEGKKWKQRKLMLILRSTLTFFLFWFFLGSVSGLLSGCTSTPIREVAAGVQAREQAAAMDLFAEQTVKPAPIEMQTKRKILTKFGDCSGGLRACADELLEIGAKLEKAEKKILKNKTVKARLVAAVVVLAILIVGFVVVRV